MLAVVMEQSMLNVGKWIGNLGINMAGRMYVDMSGQPQEEDYAVLLKTIGGILDKSILIPPLGTQKGNRKVSSTSGLKNIFKKKSSTSSKYAGKNDSDTNNSEVTDLTDVAFGTTVSLGATADTLFSNEGYMGQIEYGETKEENTEETMFEDEELHNYFEWVLSQKCGGTKQNQFQPNKILK